MNLPETFIRTLHDVHDDAEPWLAELPNTLARLEITWGLRITGLVPQLLYNLVAYTERSDGTPCVLKLSPPSDELIREGDALTYYDGDGICRLLGRDDTVGALLLERVLPGSSLQEAWRYAEDETHTRITAGLMRRLWRPVEKVNPFRFLQSWAQALYEDYGPNIPTPLLDKAQALLEDLGPDTDPVLLHADLHHGNILSATGEPYRVIDPKGIVGARGYEVGTYLLNPMQATAEELIALLPGRIDVFNEVLEVDNRELAAWGFVHAVLSACWDAEIQGDWYKRALEVAQALDAYTKP